MDSFVSLVISSAEWLHNGGAWGGVRVIVFAVKDEAEKKDLRNRELIEDRRISPQAT